MLDKILDKLGIYDVIGVLLSGVSMSILTLCTLKYVYKIQLNIIEEIPMETLCFFVISYLIGLFFQELGSLIHNKGLYRDNKLLKKALEVKDDSYDKLTLIEKEEVFDSVQEFLELNKEKDNYTIVYNYCKYSLVNNRAFEKADKEKSLSAMSRSLSLYFYLLFIVFVLSGAVTREWKYLVLFLVSLMLCAIFWYRNVRFTKMRYVNIIRSFYYSMKLQNKDE